MMLGDMFALAVLAVVFVTFLLLFVMGSCRLSGEADDAADKAARDLTDADRIWREDTAFNAINTQGRK